MTTDQRHRSMDCLAPSTAASRPASESQRRPVPLRTIALASLSIALSLAVSGEGAAAMAFRGAGAGALHATSGNSRSSATHIPSKGSRIGLRNVRPTWTWRRPGSRIALPPPSEGGDRPPRHPIWPQRPIIGRPLLPLDPGPVVTATPSGPTGPTGPAGSAASAPAGGAATAVTVANDQRFVPDEVLVSFAATVAPQGIVTFAQAQRLALLGIQRLPLINTVLYRFRITDQRQVPAVLGSLQGDARIAAAQPNYVYTLQDNGAPGELTGDPVQYVVSKMHLPQAHDLATGNMVRVAVIDSGIDALHPELQGVVAGRFDALAGELRPHEHGTAMASAIAAHGRLMGVAPGARILAVRAFDGANASAQSTTTHILDGLQWTAHSDARVVNMSFTGPADAEVHTMLAALRKKGMVLVAAAGNDGPQAAPEYPAAYPEVIAVTATDMDDHLLSVANHGRYVAVAAPGVDIFVAVPNSGYGFTTGTSVATAHVSGLAALLIERSPGLTPDAVASILMRTAKDLGPKGRDDEFGAGLVDAYEALLTLAPETAERSPAH
jgi:hypothetical protein